MKEIIVGKNVLKRIQTGRINKEEYMKKRGINESDILDEIYQYDGSAKIVLNEKNDNL